MEAGVASAVDANDIVSVSELGTESLLTVVEVVTVAADDGFADTEEDVTVAAENVAVEDVS